MSKNTVESVKLYNKNMVYSGFLSIISLLGLCFHFSMGSETQTKKERRQICGEGFSTQLLTDMQDMAIPPCDISAFSDFKTSYFANLTTNFGVNIMSSCGYVALGMLLSYYDTYLDDSIIPECYDAPSFGDTHDINGRHQSPGVLKDNYSLCDTNNDGNISSDEYLGYVLSHQNSSFHAKLISIGNGLGLYDSSSDEPCLTDEYDRVFVLTNYLSSIGLSLGIDYSISILNNSSSEIKESALQLVRGGTPVLLGVLNVDSNNRHAVVAYDSPEQSTDLYCHWGMPSSETHYLLNDRFVYNSMIAINFNINHSHTNNYVVQNVNQSVTYCYDDCGVETYTNFTEHGYSVYSSLSNDYHQASCYCGMIVSSDRHHTSSSMTFIRRGHTYANCSLCGTLVDLGAGYIDVPGINREDDHEEI